ncbi:MAG: hypothetical protein Ct9H300mP13_5190 [Gammaproteobacteria bacterium]|nr:MAG: hypothetical protein Ct9H300mP13_5190 [Gammaproteobacteria bacterium]
MPDHDSHHQRACFPCVFALAFKVSPGCPPMGYVFPDCSIFYQLSGRIFSWQIFLNDNGIINVLLGSIGLGPFSMLNTFFGTVWAINSVLTAAVVLQLISLSNVDRRW